MNSQINKQDINTVGVSATKNGNTFSSTPTSHASKMCRIGLTLALTVMMALLLASPAVSQVQVCGSSCTGSGGWAASSDAAPAYALGGEYYLAWKGNAVTNIWFTAAPEPGSWAAEAEVDGGILKTDAAPALTAWGPNYVLAWKGRSGPHIWWAEYPYPGRGWGGQNEISGVETNVAPALTSYEGTVYLAYTTTSNEIAYISGVQTLSGGIDWSAPVSLPASYVTMLPPAIAAYKGNLYFAFTTTANNIDVVSCAISSCTSWTQLGQAMEGSLPANTNVAPALTAGSYTGGPVGPYLAWTDPSDNNIYYANSQSSPPWSGAEFPNGRQRSTISPALAFDEYENSCTEYYYLDLAFTNTNNDIYTNSVYLGYKYEPGCHGTN
jgi:hypothetical protein